MEFLSDFKKKVIAGKDVEEKSIYFILFKDHEVEKLCHARIDEISDETITFRTAANRGPITVQQSDIIEITGEEKSECFEESMLKGLYRGEIYILENRSTTTLQEYQSQGKCEGCQFYGIVDIDGRKDCTFPWFDEGADEWEYGKNCDEISE